MAGYLRKMLDLVADRDAQRALSRVLRMRLKAERERNERLTERIAELERAVTAANDAGNARVHVMRAVAVKAVRRLEASLGEAQARPLYEEIDAAEKFGGSK